MTSLPFDHDFERDCSLCFGDGWITDSIHDFELCSEDEQERVIARMNELGRVACPRCQPNWSAPNDMTDRLPSCIGPRPRLSWRVAAIILLFLATAALLFGCSSAPRYPDGNVWSGGWRYEPGTGLPLGRVELAPGVGSCAVVDLRAAGACEIEGER